MGLTPHEPTEESGAVEVCLKQGSNTAGLALEGLLDQLGSDARGLGEAEVTKMAPPRLGSSL